MTPEIVRVRVGGEPDRTRIVATDRPPFFSICIPQYNRTSFLKEALRTIKAQNFPDFEVCIADDRSTDGRSHEIVEYLQESGLSFAYRQNSENLRYDGNLRTAIGLASGVYCLLMGNDDALAGPNVLARLRELLVQHPKVGLLVPNFADFGGGARYTACSAHRRCWAGCGSSHKPFSKSQFCKRTDFAKRSGAGTLHGQVGRQRNVPDVPRQSNNRRRLRTSRTG